MKKLATTHPKGVTPKAFSELYPRLYHLAHEVGVPDIIDFVISADYMTSSGHSIKQISRITF